MKESDGPQYGPPPSLGRSVADGRVFMACIADTVQLTAVLGSPSLMAVLVEDTCLRIATQDWFTRLPPRRRRTDRARWRAEGARLRRETAQLRILAEQALTVGPGGPVPGPER